MNKTLRSAILIGLFGAMLCMLFRYTMRWTGDFWVAMHMTDFVLRGEDPYPPLASINVIGYPMPMLAIGLPLSLLPNYGPPIAFFALSTGLLAYGALREKQPHVLAMLIGAAYVNAAQWSQWTPIITATWFFPVLIPLMLIIKPHIALPIFAARGVEKRGVIIAAVIFLVSFLIQANWIQSWLTTIGPYQRIWPILACPPLALAALRWRDPRGRLLLAMSLLPFRAPYDLCALWLVTRTWREGLLLVGLSWVGLLLTTPPGPELPKWLLVWFFHLPTLVLLLRSPKETPAARAQPVPAS